MHDWGPHEHEAIRLISNKPIMTQKSTQSKKRAKASKRQTVNAHAAGIDISASAEHFVAVDPDKTENCVRCFGHFTQDLYDMADWLT